MINLMEKRTEDPRPILSIFLRLSIILIVSIPWFYSNIKGNKIVNIVTFFVLFIISLLILSKFYKKNEEYALHNSIRMGYAFSMVWMFTGATLIYTMLIDYTTLGNYPRAGFIVTSGIILLFGIILFYFSNKSRVYEKNRFK